jgi:hypothetical protein
LQGLGGAFLNLLFDPASSAGPMLDVESPCAPCTGWGVSAACLSGDEAVVALDDYTLPSSPSKHRWFRRRNSSWWCLPTPWTWSAPPPFLHLRDLGRGLGGKNLPRGLPRTSRRGDLGRASAKRGGRLTVAPNRRVGDILLDGGRQRRLHVHHAADPVAALVFIAQWCRAPVYALTVLQKRHTSIVLEQRRILEGLQVD